MYSEAEASGRPRAITVRSAVATRGGLPRLVGPAVRAAHRRGDERREGVPARARVERAVLGTAGTACGGGGPARGGGGGGPGAAPAAGRAPPGDERGGHHVSRTTSRRGPS